MREPEFRVELFLTSTVLPHLIIQNREDTFPRWESVGIESIVPTELSRRFSALPPFLHFCFPECFLLFIWIYSTHSDAKSSTPDMTPSNYNDYSFDRWLFWCLCCDTTQPRIFPIVRHFHFPALLQLILLLCPSNCVQRSLSVDSLFCAAAIVVVVSTPTIV